MKKILMILVFLAVTLVPGCRWGSNEVDIDIDFGEEMEKQIEMYNQELDE